MSRRGEGFRQVDLTVCPCLRECPAPRTNANRPGAAEQNRADSRLPSMRITALA
jgi:hypothetical protein